MNTSQWPWGIRVFWSPSQGWDFNFSVSPAPGIWDALATCVERLEERRKVWATTSTSNHNKCLMEDMAVLNCFTQSPGLGRIKGFTPGVKLHSSLPVWSSPSALLHICTSAHSSHPQHFASRHTFSQCSEEQMCFVLWSNCAPQPIGPYEWPWWSLETGGGRTEIGFFWKILPCGARTVPDFPGWAQTVQTHIPLSQTFA